MTGSPSDSSPENRALFGQQQLQLFQYVWKILFPGLLLLTLINALWSVPMTAWGWREAILVSLVSLQIILFFLFFDQDSTPTKLAQWRPIIFYGSGLGLWLIELQLVPDFDWIVWLYLGIMLINESPKISIPVVGVCLLLLVAREMNWSFLDPYLFGQRVIFWLMRGAVLTILFLQFHYLYKIGEERGKLIQDLQVAQQELEQARQRDAELAVLRERERLARDMHDGLGHTFRYGLA
jgi:signal transduction histidine kinase